MMKLSVQSVPAEEISIAAVAQSPIAFPSMLDRQTTHALQRMFRDPRVLNEGERGELVAQLKKAVELEPHAPEIRVLYGMALSVDLQVQEALEQLRESVKRGPDSFIAHLKFGELLMRLRICTQAAEETQKAAELAANMAQSELARKQAAAIRTMLREGIERGGYSGLLSRFFHFPRKSRRQDAAPVILVSE
jgi:uncharacterized protein HemY